MSMVRRANMEFLIAAGRGKRKARRKAAAFISGLEKAFVAVSFKDTNLLINGANS
jgi:hypothetical protein